MVDVGAPLRHARLHLRRVLRALRAKPRGVAVERIGQIADALAAVPPQGDGRPGGTAELLGDDVEVYERHTVRDQGEATGRDFSELAAGDEQAVGPRDQIVRDAVVAAEQSRGERMGARDGPLAGHGVRDREHLRFGERRERRRRAADVHAAAREDERALCLPQQRGRGPERFRIGTRPQRRRSAAARIGGEVRGVERMTAVGDVFRDVEHHRTGSPPGGDGKGAAHELRNALNRLDPDQLLRGGAQDLHLPRLLGHVLPGMIAMAVAGDEHERGAGVQRLDHPRQQVGGAGAEGCVAHPHLAAHLGVGVGRKHAAALVVHQVVVDAEPARGIVERQELESAHAEHRADLVGGQHPRQRFAAGHLQCLVHFRFRRLSGEGSRRPVSWVVGRRPVAWIGSQPRCITIGHARILDAWPSACCVSHGVMSHMTYACRAGYERGGRRGEEQTRSEQRGPGRRVPGPFRLADVGPAVPRVLAGSDARRDSA